jgi:DNA-binding NtrC family response regulator
MRTLTTRSWPGNVRELRNFIERRVSLGWGTVHSEPAASSSGPPPAWEEMVPTHLPLREARFAWAERFEACYVKALLSKTGNNVTRAAELAGVHRRTFQRLMERPRR